jgi:hypothetical protein
MHPSGPNLPKAYQKVFSLLAENLDLAHTLHLLTLKAAVFAAAGKPEKGFSIAVRAASRAERAGLLPVLLEALAALAEILNKVGEFGASRDLAEAALPQVRFPGSQDFSWPSRPFWGILLKLSSGSRKRIAKSISPILPPSHVQLCRAGESCRHRK